MSESLSSTQMEYIFDSMYGSFNEDNFGSDQIFNLRPQPVLRRQEPPRVSARQPEGLLERHYVVVVVVHVAGGGCDC